jgi:hypothetical protein
LSSRLLCMLFIMVCATNIVSNASNTKKEKIV